MRVRRDQRHTRSAVVSGVKVVLSLRSREVITTSQPSTGPADRNAVTAWVMEQLEGAGWRVPDVIDLHKTIWG